MRELDPHTRVDVHLQRGHLTIIRATLQALPPAMVLRLLGTSGSVLDLRDLRALRTTALTMHRHERSLAELADLLGAIDKKELRTLDHVNAKLAQWDTREPQQSQDRSARLQAHASLMATNTLLTELGREKLTITDWLDENLRTQAQRQIAALQQHRIWFNETLPERQAQDPINTVWYDQFVELLTTSDLGPVRIVIADEPAMLTTWGAQMNNCIGGYHGLIGTHILGGAYARDGEQSSPLFNFEISRTQGLVQCEAPHAKPASSVGAENLRGFLSLLRQQNVKINPKNRGCSNLHTIT